MASNGEKYASGCGSRRKGDKKKRVKLPQLDPEAERPCRVSAMQCTCQPEMNTENTCGRDGESRVPSPS